MSLVSREEKEWEEGEEDMDSAIATQSKSWGRRAARSTTTTVTETDTVNTAHTTAWTAHEQGKQSHSA